MRKNVVKFFGFFVFVYFCLVMRVFASGEYVIFLDTNNIRSVYEHGSAITSVAVKETVLMVQEEHKNQIDYIPDRKNTRLARAPQSFWLDEILAAQRKAIQEERIDFIDSCSLMQYMGKKLYLIDY